MELKIPFSEDVQNWIRTYYKGKDTFYPVQLLLLAELTNNEPDAVRQRMQALHKEVQRIIYDVRG